MEGLCRFQGRGANAQTDDVRLRGDAFRVPDKALHFVQIHFSGLTMPQPMDFRIRGPGLKGWLTILVGVCVLVAIAVAVAVVAVGVFLFLLPVLVVAAAVYYLFGRRIFRRRYGQRKAPIIIDGEFRILDASEIDRKPPRQN